MPGLNGKLISSSTIERKILSWPYQNLAHHWRYYRETRLLALEEISRLAGCVMAWKSYEVPSTIDDPAIVPQIEAAVGSMGYGRKQHTP